MWNQGSSKEGEKKALMVTLRKSVCVVSLAACVFFRAQLRSMQAELDEVQSAEIKSDFSESSLTQSSKIDWNFAILNYDWHWIYS